jgi:hypothetical protein
MKARLTLVVVIGMAGLWSTGVRAMMEPARPPLANYDKRLEAAPSPLVVTAKTAAGGAATTGLAADASAVSALQARVPTARIARDGVLGRPKWISASRGFLTGPDGRGKAVSDSQLEAFPSADTNRVIKAFLNEHAALLGHDAGALNSAQVKRDYVTKHNGLRTVVWQQMHDGIPVLDALLTGQVTRRGELAGLSDLFVPDAAQAAASPAHNSCRRGQSEPWCFGGPADHFGGGSYCARGQKPRD